MNRIPQKGSFNAADTKSESYQQRNSEDLYKINNHIFFPHKNPHDKNISLRVPPQNIENVKQNKIRSEPNLLEHDMRKNEKIIIKLKISNLDAMKKSQLDKRSSSLDSHSKNQTNLGTQKIDRKNIMPADKIFENPMFDHQIAKNEIQKLEAKIRNTVSVSPQNRFNDSRGSGNGYSVNLLYDK